jgi:hypothetical protein
MVKNINPVKIESEHKLAYSKLLSYNKKHKKLPPPKMMYKWIAMDHIKEHGKKYYPALIKMEKKLK